MTIKSLLLGSAAAVAVVGGAQAADLSVAEPVEYVKVCDYFGAGYWYIPGTDTCIKIGGYVRAFANFEGGSGSSSTDWYMWTQEEVNFDVKSETEYGLLEGYMSIKGNYHGGSNEFYGDDAWLSLGGFKAGHYWSPYNTDFSYVDDFGYSNEIKPWLHNDLASLTFAAGGANVILSVEDPQGTYNGDWDSKMPIFDAVANWSMKGMSLHLGGAYGQAHDAWTNGDAGSWGIDGEIKFDFGKSDHFFVSAAYGDNAFTGGTSNQGSTDGIGANNGYAIAASLQHYFSPTFRVDADAGYVQSSHHAIYKDEHTTNFAVDVVWLPVTGFEAKAVLAYSSTDNAYFGTSNSWVAQLGVQRNW